MGQKGQFGDPPKILAIVLLIGIIVFILLFITRGPSFQTSDAIKNMLGQSGEKAGEQIDDTDISGQDGNGGLFDGSSGSGSASAGGGGSGGVGGGPGSGTGGDVSIADGSFEQSVDPPSCDPSRQEVAVIDRDDVSTRDGLESILNQEDKRVFCIKPGDYTTLSGEWSVILHAGGSSDARRYLRYYNPDSTAITDDTHPWNMDNPEVKTGNNRVILPRFRVAAPYWTFDRLRFDGQVRVEEGGHHTILNRLMFYNVPGNPDVQMTAAVDTHHVWVQNSVMGGFPEWDVGSETCCFNSGTSGQDNLGLLVVDADHIYFVDNEAWDPFNGDIVQTQIVNTQQDRIRRTVIADNDMWLTDDMREKPYENAIDFKKGPNGAAREDWGIVQNNRFWGWKNQQDYMSWSVITAHTPSTDGYLIRDNIIWDSHAAGIASTVADSSQVVTGNIIYNHERQFDDGVFNIGAIGKSTFRNNIVIDSDQGWHWEGDQAPHDVTIQHNVFISSDVGEPTYEDTGNTVTQNAFYNSQPFEGDTDGIEEGSASAANHEDLAFTVREITGPQTVTIPNGKITDQSPHSDWFQDQTE